MFFGTQTKLETQIQTRRNVDSSGKPLQVISTDIQAVYAHLGYMSVADKGSIVR